MNDTLLSAFLALILYLGVFATGFVSRNAIKPIEPPESIWIEEADPSVEPRWFLQLNGGTPIRHVMFQEGVTRKFGPGDLWICTDPDCPEGCNSRPPHLFGNGLILEQQQRGQ